MSVSVSKCGKKYKHFNISLEKTSKKKYLFLCSFSIHQHLVHLLYIIISIVVLFIREKNTLEIHTATKFLCFLQRLSI